MGNKAQAGLEYLVTYGWALILIASIIGALVFIANSPASTIAFSSSNPTKIMVKAGVVTGNDVDAILQNITGGKISVTKTTLPESYSGASCLLNGKSISTGVEITPAIGVMADGEIVIKCSGVTGSPSGRISIEYTDYAGLAGSVDLIASGIEEK